MLHGRLIMEHRCSTKIWNAKGNGKKHGVKKEDKSRKDDRSKNEDKYKGSKGGKGRA